MTKDKRLEGITHAALDRMHGKQSGPHLASPWPVSWIDDALLDGWNKTHFNQLSDDQLRSGNYPPIPDYPFAAKTTNPGAFREILRHLLSSRRSSQPRP